MATVFIMPILAFMIGALNGYGAAKTQASGCLNYGPIGAAGTAIRLFLVIGFAAFALIEGVSDEDADIGVRVVALFITIIVTFVGFGIGGAIWNHRNDGR